MARYVYAALGGAGFAVFGVAVWAGWADWREWRRSQRKPNGTIELPPPASRERKPARHYDI